MAGLKEIRRRLQSVKNTRKITYAMKLVSAAKLRKAQESVTRAREYTQALNALLQELSIEAGLGDAVHPLMEVRPIKKIACVVVGGNRGLCGGYNTNLNKRVEAFIREKNPGSAANMSFFLLGKKPAEYFRRVSRSYVSAFEDLSEDANRWPIDQVCEKIEQGFLSAEFDEVYLIYTKFRSAISNTLVCEKLLPLQGELSTAKKTAAHSGVTKFEPSALQVFAALMPRILRTKVRQAALDAKASEQGSRMTAMDSATKNAGDLSNRLQLKHNKLRQGGITSELLDIIGGAEALK